MNYELIQQIEQLPYDRNSSIRSEGAWICCPFHGGGIETEPSMKIDVSGEFHHTFYCFSGDTYVDTLEGRKKMKTLAGKSATVTDANGDWISSKFSSYGKQTLYKLVLTRNGKKKIIYTTAEHRWVHSNGGESITVDLRKNDVLKGVVRRPFKGKPSREGFKRGFIVGDGSIARGQKNPYSFGYFYDEKASMRSLFKDNDIRSYVDARGEVLYRVGKYPPEWKTDFPKLDSPKPYLLGFLQGYFAADGCVGQRNSGISISSSKKSDLVKLRDICNVLGYNTYGIKKVMRKGFGTVDTPLYSMYFYKSNFDKSFFKNPKHRKHFEESGPSLMNYVNWKVVSVSRTNRVEEVYCCRVLTTGSFILSDNLLTGNCFGCHAKGHWNKIAEIYGLDGLDTRFTPESSVLDFNFEDFADADLNMSRDVDTFEWKENIPWRGISGKTVRRYGGRVSNVLHVLDDPYLLLPVTMGGVRVGEVRALTVEPKRDKTGKKIQTSYKNSKGNWKQEYLLGYDQANLKIMRNRPLWIVEGPRDVLYTASTGCRTVGLLGSSLSQRGDMIRLLDPPLILSATDDDDAGESAHESIEEELENDFTIVRIRWGKGKDPCDTKRKKIAEKNAKWIKRLKEGII